MHPEGIYTIDTIREIFPDQCEIYSTTGIGDGIIVKFKYFYMKIYEDGPRHSYDIGIYRYNDDKRLIIAAVPYSRIREWVSNYKYDTDLRF